MRAGALLGAADPIDATVVLLANPSDGMVTRVTGDISLLATAACNRAVILAC